MASKSKKHDGKDLDYTSERQDNPEDAIPSTEELTESGEVKDNKPKKKSSNEDSKPTGMVKKVYPDKYGYTKNYIKFKEKQVEAKDKDGFDILIFEDTGEECPFYQNLTEEEIELKDATLKG